MRMKPRLSAAYVLILFSFFLSVQPSRVKAEPSSNTIVEAQANTTSSSTMAEPQGNTLSAATATGVSTLPEVQVTAHGIDQAAAFDEMHDSLNKVNVLSQDQINQTPAKTVAQAAEQLPWVGTQHD